MATYTELVSDGSYTYGEDKLFVRLYPYTSNEESAIDSKSDTIPSGLKDACSQLLNAGSIDYYEINKFEPCNGTYPKDAGVDNVGEFEWYLENRDAYKNGCGENLRDYIGSHTLVWDKDECSTNTANASGDVQCGKQGFNAGVGAVTPTSGCTDNQIQASAVQESLHNFINWDDQDVRCEVDCSLTADEYNYEHALGEVNSDNYVTPMLTYHVSEVRNYGKCSYDGYNFGYTTNLTDCTKNAVYITGNDPDCTKDQ